MKRLAVLTGALLALAGCVSPALEPKSAYHIVPGSFEKEDQPDGNSIFIEAPEGLILVDTGRHAAHSDKLLDYARTRGRPIVAIVNTHWHLDHATGNVDIRQAYPRAELYTSNAVEGALKVFLAKSRDNTERRLKAGEVPPERQAQARRFLALMNDPAPLRPTRPVVRSEDVRIAGRPLRLNLASFAATEGDVWIYDKAARTVIVGDLVVSEVPFMDTACPEGWRRALDEIAATPFTTLIPGHGEAMTKGQFLIWRTAFGNLVDCAASSRTKAECIQGWRRDAASFIRPGREALIDEAVDYYIDSRLRAAPEERNIYCRPMG